jgi:parallel beta-helix repeat protein
MTEYLFGRLYGFARVVAFFLAGIASAILPASAQTTNSLLWDPGSGVPLVWTLNSSSLANASYFGAAMPPGWHVAGAGDFGGTGFSDVLWTTNVAGGPAFMFVNTGGAVTGVSLAQYGRVPGTAWIGDFNGDGKQDILWDLGSSAPLLWTMNGPTVTAARFLGASMPAGWHIVGVGDFGGTGFSDVLWTTNAAGGPAFMFYNTASGLNGISLAQYGRVPAKAWIGDFNGDGKQDILWDNGSSQPVLWEMNGSSVSSITGLGSAMPAGWKIAAVGDFAGTGYADVLWTTTTPGGPGFLWLNVGGTRIVGVSLAQFGSLPGTPFVGHFTVPAVAAASSPTVAAASAPTVTNPVNGVCGAANAVATGITPMANLCNAGMASAVSGTGPWSWSCAGSGTGATVQCSAPLAAINGACGTANGVLTAVAPSTNLCAAGTPSAVGGLNPFSWTCSGNATGTSASCSAPAPQVPGPSLALFNNPYYSCVHNYYVSAAGSDMNNGTSAATPWLTLQHANASIPNGVGGTCVNVSPGVYNGVSLSKSGSSASSTGYIVYRCTAMDACTVNSNAQIGSSEGTAAFSSAGLNNANYVMIDGFKFLGTNAVYQLGALFTGGTSGGNQSGSHHDWVLNSIATNNGQGGIAFANGDYSYALHNLSYGNASALSCDNGAQGSGIADNVPQDVNYFDPGYVATADDKTNPNPLIGSFVTGSSWFHKSYSWNVVYNNHIAPCTGSTSADSDGNGIILDTFSTGNGNIVDYLDQTLISFNITYNNGGGGIHIFFSENATVANNTTYNNGLDPDLPGGREGIDTNDSYGNTILNNIAVAIPAANNGQCTYNYPPITPYAMFNSAILGGGVPNQAADTFNKNVTQLQGGNPSCWGVLGVDPPTGENPMFNSDVYSCSSNKCATNPQWVSVGLSSTGTESTAPVGTNFALQSGSPAIGYGISETYLPAQAKDAGACSSLLTSCP